MKVTEIRTKLLFVLLPFFILSFGILSAVSYHLSSQSLTKSIDETAIAVGSDYTNRIKADLMEAMAHLEELSNVPDIRSGNDMKQIVEIMAEAHKRIGNFDSINFISPDGVSVRMTGEFTNFGDREYFKKVMVTKKPYISEPVTTKLAKKLAVILAVPILDHGQLKGVLIGTYTLDKMTQLVKEAKIGDTGYGFLCLDNGLVIADSRMPEVINKLNLTQKKLDPDLKLQESELDDQLMSLFKTSKEQQVLGRYSFDNMKRVGVFTPINLPGDQRWVMVVTAPEAEMSQAASTLARTVLIVSLVFIIIAIIAIIILSRCFVRPIQLIRDECVYLTQGDFRERAVTVNSQDELGQLAQGFRVMKGHLQLLVKQVQLQAEQVAASSEELTASAQQSADAANQVAGSISGIAQGTEKQAVTYAHMSTIAEQMSESTEQFLNTARDLSVITTNTAQEATQGMQAVEQAVNQMNQINMGSEAVKGAIVDLATGSQEITEIVALISSIAGQTNLLALNAAIEAARAGEHGRGFAVVADEVRKLAEESNQAARQIGVLIQKNQINMDQAVDATQASTEGVKTGIVVVNSAGETFKKIVSSIMQISEQINEICESMTQMAANNRVLVASVYEGDNVRKENVDEVQTVSAAIEEQSASMQEIASSSQNLAVLASKLQAAVEKFQV